MSLSFFLLAIFGVLSLPELLRKFRYVIPQVGIHPSAAEEFVTMRSLTRRVTAGTKPKTNL